MSILVVVEHDKQQVSINTLACITAAQQINKSIDVLLIGFQCQSVIGELSKVEGVKTILTLDNEKYQYAIAENLSAIIEKQAEDYDYLLAPASTFGKNLMPRVAAKLNIEPIADIIGVVNENTFMRPIYAGNAIAKVQSNQSKHVLTVRPTAFKKAVIGAKAVDTIVIKTIDAETIDDRITFVSHEENKSDRPELNTARVVVSCGRGLQSKGKFEENFELIEQLAQCFNAAIGVSRAVVDAGYAPNEWQVGQTGKVVAPELYIAIGISGAIQHVAGMKDSKIIIAINTDEDAPIFEIADYCYTGDLFEVVPKLIEALK